MILILGENILSSDNTSKLIHIEKNKIFEKTYKLVAIWEEKEKIEGNENDVYIAVNVNQSK